MIGKHVSKMSVIAVIYIYIPEKEGTKASSRQTSVSCSGGHRGTRHMVGSLRVSGAVDAVRGYVMVMEGAEKQARRLWDEFGMKEIVKEKCATLYVGVGHKAVHVFVTRGKVSI